MVYFEERLKTLRKNLGLTQKQLADRVGVAKSAISYYENGERYPSYDVLIGLAQVFHVSTDFLLGLKTERIIDVSHLTDDQISALAHLVDTMGKDPAE